MNFSKISDKIVFKALEHLKYGKINLVNYDQKKYSFGEPNASLTADIKINKPGLTLTIINKGSVGLAEAYMRGDFETNNLTNLANSINNFTGRTGVKANLSSDLKHLILEN